MPISKRNLDEMYSELISYIDSVKNTYLNTLLNNIFVKDTAFAERFKKASAAKSVHHGFIGGLLEHTLGVVKLCDYYSGAYPVLNRDLLITAAICHDMGKTKEISAFPMNDYTDEGQFLGHIVIGSEMISKRASQIEGFPPMLEMQLKHCILSHHGEYEYGSPKKPALIEAVALNYADNTDAKMETFMEILESTKESGWLGFNKLFDSNLRGTQV
jgi:3'-5' exoribonuclease